VLLIAILPLTKIQNGTTSENRRLKTLVRLIIIESKRAGTIRVKAEQIQVWVPMLWLVIAKLVLTKKNLGIKFLIAVCIPRSVSRGLENHLSRIFPRNRQSCEGH
jgi:hypothetical protein